MRVAILERDQPQMQLLMATLATTVDHAPSDIVCTPFGDVATLRSVLDHEIPFDLFLLEYDYTEFSSLALLRWLRNERRSKVPAIMVGQRNSELDIVAVMTAGADDLIVKPIRPMELRARVGRFKPLPSDYGRTEVFGDWTLFHDSAFAIFAGFPDQVFDLGEREFNLAVVLFRNLGRVVSRYELLVATNQLDRVMNSRILDNQMFKLRKAIALESNGLTLQAVYGQGYRLITGSPQKTSREHHPVVRTN